MGTWTSTSRREREKDSTHLKTKNGQISAFSLSVEAFRRHFCFNFLKRLRGSFLEKHVFLFQNGNWREDKNMFCSSYSLRIEVLNKTNILSSETFLSHKNMFYFCLFGKFLCFLGCRHSSGDSSAPTILPPQVWVPSTPSMLLSFIVKFVLYLPCEKNENKQKEARFSPFFKTSVKREHCLNVG